MATVSIIVPVYQVEAYLPACIDSILSQEYADFELLLVDDGSPDRCGEICDGYALRDPRIRVIHQANGGLSAARNSGLEAATGEYVAFIDSDDLIPAGYLTQAMQPFLDHPDVDCVEMPIQLRYGHPSSTRYAFPVEGCIRGNRELFATWIHHQGYLHTYSCNRICRRSLFESLRFPVGEVFEDAYVTPRLLARCQTVCFVHTSAAYLYRHRTDSITATASARDFKDYLAHQLPLLDQARENPLVTRADLLMLALTLVNVFIDLLRTLPPGDDTLQSFLRSAFGQLAATRPSVAALWKLPLPLYNKLKNLPFAIAGLRFHLWLYGRPQLSGTRHKSR